MNIGTFKAFGLANRSLDKIYLSIIYLFVIAAMIIALILSYILGEIGLIKGFFILAKHEVEKGEIFFNLARPWWPEYPILGWTVFSLILILLTSYFALKYITGKIFRKTPGDLIYERMD